MGKMKLRYLKIAGPIKLKFEILAFVAMIYPYTSLKSEDMCVQIIVYFLGELSQNDPSV